MTTDDKPAGGPACPVSEQLSALLDDELPVEEIELLMAQVVASADHRVRLARFGLISSTLKGGRCAGLHESDMTEVLVIHDLAHRVRLAVDADPEAGPEPRPWSGPASGPEPGTGPGIGAAVAAGQSPSRRRWVPYAAAAGVALLAVVLVPRLAPQWQRTGGMPEAAQMARDDGAISQARPGLAAVAPAPPAALRSPAELIAASDRASISPQRIASYLVYHGEFSGMLAAKLTDSHIVTRRTYAVDVAPADHLADHLTR